MPVKLFYDDGDGVSPGVRPFVRAYNRIVQNVDSDLSTSLRAHAARPSSYVPRPIGQNSKDEARARTEDQLDAGASPLHPQDGKISRSALALLTIENATGKKHTIIPTRYGWRIIAGIDEDYRAAALRIGERFKRAEIYTRDKGICYLCGCWCPPDKWHLDHIHPLRHDGLHARDNVAVTCPPCNYKKGAHITNVKLGRVE